MTLNVAWVRGHHFLTSRLGAASVVVDLGAHRGEFSAELVRRFACRCVALEPVATLIGRPDDLRIEVRHEAIASRDGPVVLHLKQNPEATTLLDSADADAGDVTVAGTTWRSLCQRAGLERIALLKIDVEGAEVDLLRAMTAAELGAIEQLTVEFHPELTGVRAVRDILARLRSLGFWVVRFSRGYGDVLVLNPAVFGLGIGHRLWLRFVTRNWLGLKRVVRRWAGVEA